MSPDETDVIHWIENNLACEECGDASSFYEGVRSQSGQCLPILYQPFDVHDRLHWIDRGAVFDFVSTAGRGRLLDFGPGDGWPSLLVAPFVEEVVGIDAAPGLVEIQKENARRLGIENVSFAGLRPGDRLPFEDESFDGAMAASSLEQTADPQATLAEIRRVLKPGASLRVSYEALSRYKGGRDHQLWIGGRKDGRANVSLSHYRVGEERARHLRLVVAMSPDALYARLGTTPADLTYETVTIEAMEALRGAVDDVRACTLTHASGPTLARWMVDVGFACARGTHAGQAFAAGLYERTPEARRPMDLAGVDALLRDAVPVVTALEAPLADDPRITATCP